MQTFAEFMAESFRSNAHLTWSLGTETHATASFTVDSVKVIVSFERGKPEAPWRVQFEVQKGGRSDVAYTAFSIFNGVFQAVREFVGARQPEVLVFATKRDELAGIYHTYLRRESTALEELGYELEGPHRANPLVEFTLKRASREISSARGR
jgi:hypothetical protein